MKNRIPLRLDFALRQADESPHPSNTNEPPLLPAHDTQASVPAHEAQTLKMTARLKRMARRLVGGVTKPLLRPLRAYLSVTVSEQISAEAQRSDQMLANTFHAAQQVQQTMFKDQDLLIQSVIAHNEQLLRQNQEYSHSILTQVAHLNGRADEIIRRSHAIFPLRDAYAIRLEDGYVFLPLSEERSLLSFSAAPSAGPEPGTRRVIQRVLQPGQTAIDVGANIGTLTLAMARNVGSEGHVFSFEAEPRLIPYLEKARYENGLSWVNIMPVALGAESGTVAFNISTVIGHSSLLALPSDEQAETIDVKIEKLDDVLGERPVNLVKIDVEGAELDVLKGMSETLRRSEECIIIAELGASHLARHNRSLVEWFDAFRTYGFEPAWINESNGDVQKIRLIEDMNFESVNIAFFRPGTASAMRLLSNRP